MIIAIGSDHAGFTYKEKIKESLSALGHTVTDFGTHSEEPVDYPLFIRPVAEAVARGDAERGVVLGGSGNGCQPHQRSPLRALLECGNSTTGTAAQ
jgi:ribose 5-phosphate isomerase B